eukprot:TRINITY_DN2812_c0_g1_i1.p1 TRINITY_DN2812_c0_g1~~TRINITY_DN2812_c0_g1_i1.p1  ORF type:complete len:120 (-),score=3.65 TRINITY_DN2812_c0_g1_i1:1077-1436(-)
MIYAATESNLRNTKRERSSITQRGRTSFKLKAVQPLGSTYDQTNPITLATSLASPCGLALTQVYTCPNVSIGLDNKNTHITYVLTLSNFKALTSGDKYNQISLNFSRPLAMHRPIPPTI